MIGNFISTVVGGISAAYRKALKTKLENDTAEVLMEHAQNVHAQLASLPAPVPVVFVLPHNPNIPVTTVYEAPPTPPKSITMKEPEQPKKKGRTSKV